MNRPFFNDFFRFYEITRGRYHYSDNRRGSPEHYLAYMVQGRCRIVSDTKTITVRAGDLFYIPMGLPYQSYWYGDKDNVIRFLSFGFRWSPETDVTAYSLQVLPNCEEWTSRLCRIPTNTIITSKAVSDFFSLLSDVFPVMEGNASDAKFNLLQKAMSCMYEHTEYTAAAIAHECGVSESTLYTVFREQLGKTPNVVKQELRCEKAVFLLSTSDKSVQEISDELGFSSPSYFRKILKAHTDSTPREIRCQFRMA